MFRQKTTIVVGAGASCEIGLPSGEQLKSRIAELVAISDENAYGLSSGTMVKAVDQRLGQVGIIYAGGLPPKQEEIASIKTAAQRIERGLPLAMSIDNFLHTHQNDTETVRLGKAAIAITILEAEGASALFARFSVSESLYRQEREPPRRFTLDGDVANSWYAPFAQLLMSGVQRHEVGQTFANLRFIIFNYDRCLEQYLYLALQAYFDMPPAEAARVLSGVEFLHVYGSLGPLPWQAGEVGDTVPLGGSPAIDVWQVGSRIRTFTESVGSQVEPQIKSAIQEASTIILLGFGYLDQNVQLLQPRGARSAKRVMSTAYKVSEEDQLVMKDCMKGFALTDARAMIEPGSCRAFFDRFRLQLSLR